MMTTMASATTMFSFGFGVSPSKPSISSSNIIVHLSPFTKKPSLNFSSSHTLCGFGPLLPNKLFTVAPRPQNPPSFTVFAAKGYKMKTHKASAKRFRVTGRGKIVRRRAGKQHLLRKKNAKRRLRLSKMIQVDRGDYDNVIGALPYLKVNRLAK